MAANRTYSTLASASGVTINQNDESAIRQRVDQPVQETGRLRQLLRYCQSQVASSSEQHSSPQTTLHPQILTSDSTLVNAGLSAITGTTSVPQPGDHFLYTENRTEYPSTPSTASFPSFPMSPFPMDEGTGRYPDIIEHRHSRFLTSLPPDGRSTPVTHLSSVPEAVDGPTSFPVSRIRSPTLSTISHRARASTSTPLTSPRPRGRHHRESSEERLQYKLIIDVLKQHCFIRDHRFNRIKAVRLWSGEPYTRETIPWPIDIDDVDFLDILERALSLHTEDCDMLRSPPTECRTCIARMTVKGILTRVLNKTLNTGQSIFDIRDRWYPNDDWLSIAVDRMDQLFVRRGMVIVHECICSIIERIGAPDPMIWRMSMAEASTSDIGLFRL